MHCFLLLALILYPVATEGVILFSDQARAAGVDDAGEANGAVLVITTVMAGAIWWWAASGHWGSEPPAAATATGVHLVWTAADTAPLSDGIAAGLPIDGMKPTVQPVRGDGTFADMSELLDSQIQTMGAAFVDNDGDGDLDLYLLHYQSTSQYYRNDGAFFSKVATRIR